MAENIIKDFVQKQTSTVTIGVPKKKTAVAENPSERPAAISQQEPAQFPAEADIKKTGRPKAYENRTKISTYLPEEMKDKLVKIQHRNLKPSLNEVMLEAVKDLLAKYSSFASE